MICRLRFIPFFVRSWSCVLAPLSNGLKLLIYLLKYSQSDVLWCVSDNVVNIWQHKLPNYIYPRRKKIPLFIRYMTFYVLCWTYMSPRLLPIWLNALCCFFSFPLFRYTLFSRHQFLKELLWKYFLACLIRFLCVRVIFCLFNCFCYQKVSWKALCKR